MSDSEAEQIGPYLIVRKLPTPGNFAKSYECRHPDGHHVHVKKHLQLCPGTPDGESFWSAQQALQPHLAQLREYVVPVEALFELDEHYVLVSKWTEGTSLLWAYEELEDSKRLDWAGQLAACVAEIHALGVAHRDLNPTNVIVVAGRLLLVDFDGASVNGLPGYPMGTPWYASPEHYLTDRLGPPGQSSDLFTLGILIHEILTGYYPFDRDAIATEDGKASPSRFIQAVEDGDIPSLSDDDVDAGDELEDALLRCMGPDPQSRCTASELQAILKRESANSDSES